MSLSDRYKPWFCLFPFVFQRVARLENCFSPRFFKVNSESVCFRPLLLFLIGSFPCSVISFLTNSLKIQLNGSMTNV